MARSRLFSSARAIASCNEIYSLPSRVRRSMRDEFCKFGSGTWLGAYASNGLCEWGIARRAGVCMESCAGAVELDGCGVGAFRSEEHTSELQSLRHLVCRLLLEKKKNKRSISHHIYHARPNEFRAPGHS